MEKLKKKCPVCKRVKPYEDYGVNRHQANGRESYCKPCRSKLNAPSARAWALANPKRKNEIDRKYWHTTRKFRVNKTEST